MEYNENLGRGGVASSAGEKWSHPSPCDTLITSRAWWIGKLPRPIKSTAWVIKRKYSIPKARSYNCGKGYLVEIMQLNQQTSHCTRFIWSRWSYTVLPTGRDVAGWKARPFDGQDNSLEWQNGRDLIHKLPRLDALGVLRTTHEDVFISQEERFWQVDSNVCWVSGLSPPGRT